MAEISSFALRMPPEFKEAAKVLSKVYIEEHYTEGDNTYVRSVGNRSINEIIIFLMRRGLKDTLDIIEKDIARKTEELAMWQEFVAFFMQNPAARNVLPINLPSGSKSRCFLEKCMEDPNSWQDGFDRAQATDDFASAQRSLFELTEAKGAVQRALAAE